MKAVIFHEHGGLEVLRHEEVKTPEPGADEVLIRVHASTINRGLDSRVREYGFGFPGFTLPHVGGSDPAGEVVSVGTEVTDVSEGDRVVVSAIINDQTCDFCKSGAGENYCRNFEVVGVNIWGGHAEYVKVPARLTIRLPDSVSFEQAACLPVSYNPAWHGLVTLAGVNSDDTVLVVAAGSGVGVAATQIAKHFGARVIATAGSDWKLESAKELGADEVANYSNEDWSEQVRELTDGKGVTLAFDNVGQPTWPQSLGLLDRSGRMVCSGSTGDPNIKINLINLYRNMTKMYFHMQGSYGDLEQLVKLVGEGSIQPVIDSRYPLEEAAKAEERLLDRAIFGKVVLVS